MSDLARWRRQSRLDLECLMVGPRAALLLVQLREDGFGTVESLLRRMPTVFPGRQGLERALRALGAEGLAWSRPASDWELAVLNEQTRRTKGRQPRVWLPVRGSLVPEPSNARRTP